MKLDVYADNVTVPENYKQRKEDDAPALEKFSLDEISVLKVKDHVTGMATKPPETPAFMSDPIVRKPPEYELHGDVIEADTKLLGKVSTQYFVKADPKPNKKAKYVGNGWKKRKKTIPRRIQIHGRKRMLRRTRKRKKRIRMLQIPRRRMKNPTFRISPDSKSDPNPVRRWQCHNMLPASILRKVSAATIMMIQLLTSSHHLSLPKSELPTCAKFPAAIVNIFRLKSLGLQPEGGDTDKVTFHVEKSDEAEVGIKTLALEKKFLDILANPKGGN